MNAYDVIVVGARCAGSPTAMLLARKGYRVLVVDRASFPSDTISTHVIHPIGSAALARWGLLDRLQATGCPPINTYTFDFGPFTLAGAPGAPELPPAYCPKRTVLDKLLVDAASEAGAEVREHFVVESLIHDDDRVAGIKGHTRNGTPVAERADVVVGADGRHSLVAEAVRAHRYDEKPPLLAPYYTYWRDLPMEGRFESYIRPNRGFAAAPTSDGLTITVGGWPYAEFESNKRDVEGHLRALFEQAPAFAERIRAATRVAPFAGTPVSNYFRKPYGPGWTLVGDAGYNKDPITAQGISDAFRDAEQCAGALHDSFSGSRGFDDVMSEWQRTRDDHARPMYEFTCQLATLQPPPPEMQQLFAAISRNTEAMHRFVQMNAGTISPAEFFSPTSIAGMLGASASH